MIGCNSSGRASKIDVFMCPVMYLRSGSMASIIDHGDGPQYIYLFWAAGTCLEDMLDRFASWIGPNDERKELAIIMILRNWSY